MKIKLFLVIICLFTLSANSVFALKYTDMLGALSENTGVSEQHLQEAQLLQNYIARYQEDINVMYLRYTDTNSNIMRDTNLVLDDMTNSLDIILNKQADPKLVEASMLEIVKDIKIVSANTKVYLKASQQTYEQKLKQKKQQYIQTGRKISQILSALEGKLTRVLLQKQELSPSERKVIKSLVRIRNENRKIQNFQNITFLSEAEMKLYFKNIITELKKEISIIRNASK